MMSSTCSMPMLSRIISGRHTGLPCSSGDICRWVVEAGWQASDLASPDIDQPLDQLQRIVEAHSRGEVRHCTPKVSSEQARPPRYFCASA